MFCMSDYQEEKNLLVLKHSVSKLEEKLNKAEVHIIIIK